MAEESLGPDYLTTRGIPTSRRGYDKRVVDAVLAEARTHWQALVDKHEELVAQVEETGGLEFLGKELTAIGQEVGEVLDAAQKAADGIRARSREEADQIQREAAATAEELVAEADQQAFDLRQDAWNSGMELLDSADAERERVLRAAKDDALLIRAQAEKDAHRHIAGAERESGDLIRQARYEADRLLNQARELAQQIIDRAAAPQYLDPSDAVQVNDPAAGAARDEILGEIDRIRTEQSIESVKVFENEPRLPSRDDDDVDLSDVLAADVEELWSSPEESEPEPAPSPPSPRRQPEVVRVDTSPAADQFGTDDDVGTLFEALRETGETEPVGEEERLPADPFELREQLVLPIVNEGVRDAKRRIVDLQNEALSGLRGAGWEPDPPTIGRLLGSGLEPMILKAASAGARAADPLAGLKGSVAEPGERATQVVTSLSASLSGQLGAALEAATGPEQAAEAVSKVFRSWRDDGAQRWVRRVVHTAYHDSLLAAMRAGGVDKVAPVSGDGPTCDECPVADGGSWRPGRTPPEGTSLPPATLHCSCTIVVASD